MKCYTTDLSGSQWLILEKKLDSTRKRKYPLQTIWNAIMYILSNGVKWRDLPKEYPDYRLVFYCFAKWTKTGVITKVQGELLRELREKLGRDAEASLGIIDSQSVKTSELADKQTVGVDGNKKVKGRKRHIVIDFTGHLLLCVAHAANIRDDLGALKMLDWLKAAKRLKKILADAVYEKTPYLKDMCGYYGIDLETVRKEEGQKGFVPQKKRWMVERTFAWIRKMRRLTIDYERKPEHATSWVYIADIRLIVKQLSKI